MSSSRFASVAVAPVGRLDRLAGEHPDLGRGGVGVVRVLLDQIGGHPLGRGEVALVGVDLQEHPPVRTLGVGLGPLLDERGAGLGPLE